MRQSLGSRSLNELLDEHNISMNNRTLNDVIEHALLEGNDHVKYVSLLLPALRGILDLHVTLQHVQQTVLTISGAFSERHATRRYKLGSLLVRSSKIFV